jgi:hypothetical protein
MSQPLPTGPTPVAAESKVEVIVSVRGFCAPTDLPPADDTTLPPHSSNVPSQKRHVPSSARTHVASHTTAGAAPLTLTALPASAAARSRTPPATARSRADLLHHPQSTRRPVTARKAPPTPAGTRTPEPRSARAPPVSPSTTAQRPAAQTNPLCVRVISDTTVHVDTTAGKERTTHTSAQRPPPAPGSTFTFDAVFSPSEDPAAAQSAIFSATGKKAIDHALAGRNACLFAYGQTGSGKTFTMFGPPDGTATPDAGIIPRICVELFERIAAIAAGNVQRDPDGAAAAPCGYAYRVEASFFEIYNENVNCLLTGEAKLKWRDGVPTQSVSNAAEALALLSKGAASRHTGETAMNKTSSRSHAVFQLLLRQELSAADGTVKERSSQITLVDLAGAERRGKSNPTAKRMKEGVAINCSLTRLGTVMSALALRGGVTPSAGPTFIDYRSSVLTRILQPDLEGRSKIFAIATISPATVHSEETLSTLRYANLIKRIPNAPISEDTDSRAVRALKPVVVPRDGDVGVPASDDAAHPVAFLVFTNLPTRESAVTTTDPVLHGPLWIPASALHVCPTTDAHAAASLQALLPAADTLIVRLPPLRGTAVLSLGLRRVRGGSAGDAASPSEWQIALSPTQHPQRGNRTVNDVPLTRRPVRAAAPGATLAVRSDSGALPAVHTALRRGPPLTPLRANAGAAVAQRGSKPPVRSG